jgi:hypothetical protein
MATVSVPVPASSIDVSVSVWHNPTSIKMLFATLFFVAFVWLGVKVINAPSSTAATQSCCVDTVSDPKIAALIPKSDKADADAAIAAAVKTAVDTAAKK